MKKKLLATMMVAVLAIGTMTGCGSKASTDATATTDETTADAETDAAADETADECHHSRCAVPQQFENSN